MIFPKLDASGYKYSITCYNAEFESILAKIINCYKLTQIERIKLSDNENEIRDTLLYTYLKKENYKRQLGLDNYLFDPELPENTGRIDIRIMPINPFINDDAYYIIECKRLDTKNVNGISGLNGKYISNGICRFTSSKYSCYHKVNGMMGFIVKTMNIQENINCINNLINTLDFPTKILQNIQPMRIVDDFEYTYYSIHNVKDNKIIIYHLMLDFSKNIEKKN